MPGRDLGVVLTRRLPPPVEARMAELFALGPLPDDRPIPPTASPR